MIRFSYSGREISFSQSLILDCATSIWARLKIGKTHTTIVIDEDKDYDKQKKEIVDGYVHREATHTSKKDYEEIKPNTDKSDVRSTYLKLPQKTSKHLFKSHNKNPDMPEDLRKNTRKIIESKKELQLRPFDYNLRR